MHEDLFKKIAEDLQPERPIRSTEKLRGREDEFAELERELRYFSGIPFIFGHRGVGKTSLARTVAQMVTPADREHIYVACAPNSRMLRIFKEIGEQLIKLAFSLGQISDIKSKVQVNISINPSIRTSFEEKRPQLEEFEDANAAVRVLKELDDIIPDAKSTVIVIDELEELNKNDRTDLAYLIKQLGDQEFKLKFILVGIAENVHELIGAHESVPRYIKEVSLKPLIAQYLMDVVSYAADSLNVLISKDILFRIAIIGNGFPYFAHLMGKALLTEAVLKEANEITNELYLSGVKRAVKDSIQELKISYEAATQRGDDYYKHMIWALAHSDFIDVRTDEWKEHYAELCRDNGWVRTSDKKFSLAMGNLRKENYGHIITNSPDRYGSSERRNRYKRFASTLERGHVRLQAESEGVFLGKDYGL